MKKYNVTIIGIEATIFMILFFCLFSKPVQSQVFEEEQSLSFLESNEKTIEGQIELTATRGYKEAYICPMYLLMLSELIYSKESWKTDRYADKAQEVAIGITNIARNIAEIVRERTLNSTLQFKDESIKTKLLSYLKDIIKVAGTQINSFETGGGKDLDPIDKYKYLHFYEVIKEAEEIFKIHIYQGDEGANFAQHNCPFQFLVWSETWPSANENEAGCQSCVKIAELTKDLMLQLRKYYLYLWEEEYAEVMDEYKDEFRKEDKEPSYFGALISQAEALAEYRRIGNKLSLDAAKVYRKEATKKFYDYVIKHGD